MPRLRKSGAEQDGIVRLLKGYDVKGITLTQILNFKSAHTGSARLKNPATLTIGEYVRVCKMIGIPAEEARNAMRFS